MSSASSEIDINQWIEYCNQLSALETFALLGLLIDNPHLSLTQISAEQIVTEGNLKRAEQWMLKNIRSGLKIYCDNHKKYQAVADSKALESLLPFIKPLVPFLALELNAPLIAMVAFVMWALKYGLDKWCDKCAAQEDSGEGDYSGDLTPNKTSTYFTLSYLPPIDERVEDEKAYPLVVYKARVVVPAETKGKVRVTLGANLDAITVPQRGGNQHPFEFSDAIKKKRVKGVASSAYPLPNEGISALALIAGD